MTGGRLFRHAKKIASRVGSTSSSGTDSRSTPTHDVSQEPEHSETQQLQQQAVQSEEAAPNEAAIWMTDQQGTTVRHRGCTTCADLQTMPPGTRIHIEINEDGVPCNAPECVLLGPYMGVVARDPVLAPISFSDWRNKVLEPFKRKMLAEIESKFEFPEYIRHWIMKSIGVKWRNHKTNLKATHWDSRELDEIMEDVPEGVDQLQWCQLVTQWAKPSDKERAAKNTVNAKKQTCPHTMGRISCSVRKQKEAVRDRLQLWKINRMRKNNTWSSEDARLRWVQACELLAEEGLTPEDGNVEANERVFKVIMGPEHAGRVRTQGFGVTPTRFFPQSIPSSGESSSSPGVGRMSRIENDMQSLRTEMKSFMHRIESRLPPLGGLQTGDIDHSSEA